MRLLQRDVLAVLYYMTNGTDWTDATGWLDPTIRDECTWHETGTGSGSTVDPTTGVVVVVVMEDPQHNHNKMCDAFGRIDTINLRKNNLSGPFPTEVVLLSDTLTHMRLNGNSLTGTIPSALFDGRSGSYMTKLERFHIHWNAMTGTIPNIVGSTTTTTTTTNTIEDAGTVDGNGLPNLLSLRL